MKNINHGQRCRGSGGTIKGYAESNGLSLPAMHFWRRELIVRGILDEKSRNPRNGQSGDRRDLPWSRARWTKWRLT
ncbi:MAG: hypothetical protein H7839_24010 [Magnetococcus sp. YQC-5]